VEAVSEEKQALGASSAREIAALRAQVPNPYDDVAADSGPYLPLTAEVRKGIVDGCRAMVREGRMVLRFPLSRIARCVQCNCEIRGNTRKVGPFDFCLKHARELERT
jgi:hypothetical protein